MKLSKTSARSSLLGGAASILITLSLDGITHAANITWGGAENITRFDTNVINTGTVMGAFNVGAPGVPGATVNGVTFAPFEIDTIYFSGSTTVGNFTLGFDAGTADNSSFGSTGMPFSLLSSGYQTLLQSAAYDADLSGLAITLTMHGLTVGGAY